MNSNMNFFKSEVWASVQTDTITAKTVSHVIEDVSKEGDSAVKAYTERFDGTKLEYLRLSAMDIDERVKPLDTEVKKLIDRNHDRIMRFAQFQRSMYRDMEMTTDEDKTLLGQRVIPIDSVGIYVPAGRFPLLSSSLMGIIPAKVAGVRKIVVCTPPGKGKPHPATLYGIIKAGATDVFTIGGAQAIAAMALGTESVPKVDKIAGPGNKFVNEAKRALFGKVGIDLLAGPSEVLILADETAVPETVIYDLLAQAEHDVDARACLVTTSKEFAMRVNDSIRTYIETLPTRDILRISWETHGCIAYSPNIEMCINFVNEYAPEHLEMHLDSELLDSVFIKLRNYGSAFLGADTPVVLSDKLIGTNHILPTLTASRYSGGLSVGNFLKVLTYQKIMDKKTSSMLARSAQRQSDYEGLSAHGISAKLRILETEEKGEKLATQKEM